MKAEQYFAQGQALLTKAQSLVSQLNLNKNDDIVNKLKNLYQQAIVAFTQVIKLQADYPNANYFLGQSYYNLSELYFHIGNNPEALAFLKQAIDQRDIFPEAYCAMAKILHKMGNAHLANRALDLAKKHQERYAKESENLGLQANQILKVSTRNIAELKIFEEASELKFEGTQIKIINPDLIEYRKGRALQNLGQFDEAIIAYEKMRDPSFPFFIRAQVFRADSLFQIKKVEEALALYQQVIRYNPVLHMLMLV